MLSHKSLRCCTLDDCQLCWTATGLEIIPGQSRLATANSVARGIPLEQAWFLPSIPTCPFGPD